MKRILLTMFALSFSVASWNCSNDGIAEDRLETEKGLLVKTTLLQPRSFAEYLEITGTVKARNQINIVVEEGGLLKQVRRDKGRFASKGDTLAILENQVLGATYQEAAAALRQAELTFRSKKVLFGKKAIPENEYLASQYDLERAQASYELTQARYNKLFIIAPYAGFVNNRFYDDGAYLNPNVALFDFIDNAYVKIAAGVAERFISDIDIGTPVEIRFDAFPDLKINSKVSFVSKSIEPASRTFEIEIEVRNPERKLAPQMIANLKILRQHYDDCIVVPLDALIESEEGRYAFVEVGKTAKKVLVAILAVAGDTALVKGLEPGQHLVVVGHQELTEGDSLVVVKEQADLEK